MMMMMMIVVVIVILTSRSSEASFVICLFVRSLESEPRVSMTSPLIVFMTSS